MNRRAGAAVAACHRRLIQGVATGLLTWCVMGPSPATVAAAAVSSEILPAEPSEPSESPHAVTGAFVHYVPEDQEITVLDDNGEELILAVDPGVLPAVDGRTVAFDQLRDGDRLTLTVVGDDNGDEYVTSIQVARAPADPAAP